MKGAYPLHSPRHDSSPIERATLRTLNAARKRIDILCCCFGEDILTLFNKGLSGIEYILFDNAGVGTLCVEAIFLSTIGVLVEGNGGFSVGLLIKAVADVPFVLQNICHATWSPDFLSGLGRDVEVVQLSCDLACGEALQVQSEDIPHNACFRLVHGQHLID